MSHDGRNAPVTVPNWDGRHLPASRPRRPGGRLARLRSDLAAGIVVVGALTTVAWAGLLGWGVFLLVGWALG